MVPDVELVVGLRKNIQANCRVASETVQLSVADSVGTEVRSGERDIACSPPEPNKGQHG